MSEKDQWEEEAIARFVVFLNERRSTAYAITGRDVRPDPSSKKDFDYQIQNTLGEKVAVEIFRLIEDGKDLARDRMWAEIVGHLKRELLEKNIKGYVISTPHFSVKKRQLRVYSTKLADQLATAIRDNVDKPEFESDGFEFRRLSDLDTVAFSRVDGVRSVDPAGTSARSFVDLLPTKNQQLATLGHERILLVLNWAHFVDAGDAIRALTKIDLAEFSNIDQIYLEQRPGTFYQVFDRRVLDTLSGKELEVSITPLLIENLRYRLGDKDRVAFEFVRQQVQRSGGISWLDDDASRENLVHFGEELLKGDATDDALWVMRLLKDDPDPPSDGSNCPDDPTGKYNYHAKVLAGDDNRIITTVRGHLCWLMARLIGQNKPEYYTEIIEIVRRYISEPNLYIRIQATQPLFELVRRRKAVRTQDGSSFNWDAAERELVVELAFDMLRCNARYPRVMEALLRVFNELRDLSDAEARSVLTAFLATKQDDVLHDLAALVVYYALFRKRAFPELPFDEQWFKQKLREEIVEGGSSSMRRSLAWHLWSVMKEDALPYPELRDYLFLFWEKGYSSGVASMFGLVFEQLAKKSPEDAIVLFERIVSLLKATILANPAERANIWVNGVEHVYPVLGRDPTRLLRITKDLKEVWMAGCPFIGDIPMIFESYASVPEPFRNEVKSELQAIYADMKAHQPRLPEVNWNRS